MVFNSKEYAYQYTIYSFSVCNFVVRTGCTSVVESTYCAIFVHIVSYWANMHTRTHAHWHVTIQPQISFPRTSLFICLYIGFGSYKYIYFVTHNNDSLLTGCIVFLSTL